MKNLKKVLALVLAFACAFTMFAGAAFTDQADIESSDAVDTLVALGVIEGYTDGSFRPETTVTRAEMAKMIYTILNGGNDDASAYENLPTSFTDLTEDWYKGYVKYLQNSDIIAGTSATTFAPNETVTGVEAAKMMLVAAGYTPDKAGLTGLSWRVNTMRYANANSLFADVNCDINSGLPRQYAAQILYNSLDMENVVYSKDIDGFKPATDVNEDRTIGGKYMDLTTYEGMLLGSGEYGASNEKIALQVRKIDGRDYTDKDGKTTTYNESFNYAEDLTGLVGQYVKVTTGKNDKVYGVFAVSSENTVVTAALSDIEKVSGTNKVKVNGTEYKYDSKTCNVYGTDLDTAVMAVSALPTSAVNSADTITFISNDGDSTFDIAYINPIQKVAKVTYVSSTSFTAGGKSYDFDDVIAPSDLAKDDYVVVHKNLFADKDEFVKADKVTGKITSSKGAVDKLTDVKLENSDEWYKVAGDNNAVFAGMVGYQDDRTDLDLKNTYELVVVDGVVYSADKKASGSSDTALVTGASDSMDTDGNRQVKLLFADGSEKVVPAKVDYTSNVIKDVDTVSSVSDIQNAFVTYEINDGVYELTVIADDTNLDDNFGTDYTYTAVAAGYDKDAKKLNGVRVADDAVIYVQYADGSDSKVKAISGADLTAMGADFGTKTVYVTDGTLVVAAVISENDYLPGASADKLYGYITSDISNNNDGDTAYKSFTVWTTENESVDVKMKKTSVNVIKGDLISFDLTADNFIENVKSANAGTLAVETGAIKSVGSSYILFYTATDETEKSDYKLSDDVKYLYLNTKDVEGVNGGELKAADKNTVTSEGGAADGVYYKNVKYVLEDNEIIMIAIDATLNKWDGAGSINTTKTAADQ